MREKDVNLPCRIFAILVMLFLLAPLVVIVIASFTPTALITFPPQGFSLKWYANIFGSSTHFMDGLVNSLKIGILATAADILLGVTAALSVCRYSFKGKVLYFTELFLVLLTDLWHIYLRRQRVTFRYGLLLFRQELCL